MLVWGIPVPGYPSLMVAIMVIGGMQLLVMGVMVVHRPHSLRDQSPRPSISSPVMCCTRGTTDEGE